MARGRSPRTSYSCSFCGKTQEQVRRLITGSAGVYICNECVDFCTSIIDDEQARTDYAFALRMVVAFSVGVAIVIGVLRILKGWPIHRLIIAGYVLVTIMTVFAPDEVIGVAYDSGGVTTSTITVPLVTALGVGLATSIKGRNPMIDGFGLIAFASLAPMIFVLAWGMAG